MAAKACDKYEDLSTPSGNVDWEALARHLIQQAPLFPLDNPGILSIPLGFLGAVLGTLMGRELEAEKKFTELFVRANTGLGAEKASEHWCKNLQ